MSLGTWAHNLCDSAFKPCRIRPHRPDSWWMMWGHVSTCLKRPCWSWNIIRSGLHVFQVQEPYIEEYVIMFQQLGSAWAIVKRVLSESCQMSTLHVRVPMYHISITIALNTQLYTVRVGMWILKWSCVFQYMFFPSRTCDISCISDRYDILYGLGPYNIYKQVYVIMGHGLSIFSWLNMIYHESSIYSAGTTCSCRFPNLLHPCCMMHSIVVPKTISTFPVRPQHGTNMEPCHCHPLSTCGFYLWFLAVVFWKLRKSWEHAKICQDMPRYAKLQVSKMVRLWPSERVLWLWLRRLQLVEYTESYRIPNNSYD